MDLLIFRGNKVLAWCAMLLVAAVLIVQIYYLSTTPVNTQATIFIVISSAVTVYLQILRCLFTRHLSFVVGFLLSTFFMIISWRLSSLMNIPLINYLYAAAIICKFFNYTSAVYHDLEMKRGGDLLVHHNTRFEWQLILIRLAIGVDLIPHFCEKLFAGNMIRADDIAAFTTLGVPHPELFVIIAGLCELAGAFTISCGFFTRSGAVCIFIYLMVATYLGKHFTLGFIWASPGGGWEFPVIWGVLFLSFCIFGANSFSLDAVLKRRYSLPAWIRFLMGGSDWIGKSP